MGVVDKNAVIKNACYILELPDGAEFLFERTKDRAHYKYYHIEDEEGERYVFTDEYWQDFNKKMIEATRRIHKKGG